MSEQEKLPWYKQITQKVCSLSEELGLDDFSTSKLRETVLSIAKEQYLAGNRSGIRWARTQIHKTTTE